MKEGTVSGPNPRTEEYYLSEVSRLGAKIRQMLANTRRYDEESKRLS